MNDKSKLDEMKKLWEKEVDEYLIKAATVDLNEYPIEVQQIIKEEVSRRGLENVKYCKPSNAISDNADKEGTKRKNSWIVIVILVIVAIMAKSVVREICRDLFPSIGNDSIDYAKSDSKETLDSDKYVNAMLKTYSEKINKQCPMKVDKYTTALGAFPQDRKVIYRYQLDINMLLEDSNSDLTNLKDTMKQRMITEFCSNPSFDTFKKHDVEMEYQYTDLDGTFLFKFVINKSLCAE